MLPERLQGRYEVLTTKTSPKLLKIGQLAKRAGVARGTIQHYLREGLLPPPLKTFRNMAYYDESYVEQIRHIKELQASHHLPLSVIRTMLDPKEGDRALAKAVASAQEAAVRTLSPALRSRTLTLPAAAKAFGLPTRVIADLMRIGLVTAKEESGKRVFSGPDLEVLAAVSHLEKLGLSERAGFSTGDLAIYRDALLALLHEETRTFLRVVMKRSAGEDPAELARSAIEGATLLVIALRKKLIWDLLSTADSKTIGGLIEQATRDGRPKRLTRRRR